MKAIALTCVLFVSGCCTLPAANPDQPPEQKLLGACNGFYDTLEAALIHDLSLDTLTKMQYAERSVDPLCEPAGPALRGMTASQALLIVEGFLAQAAYVEKEGDL